MTTNLALDDGLIKEARDLGKHKTKKEAVTVALQQYIKWRKQMRIFKLAGKIDYYPDYDYKGLRGRKRG